LRLGDAWLAQGQQSTYVRGADGYYSRLRRIQSPGAAVEPLDFGDSSVFRPSFRASASRAAGKKGRLPARVAFGPAHFRSRAGLSKRRTPISDPGKGFAGDFRRARSCA